ncbi:MAG: hypothetical protein VR69_13585 [Peptococcaceae bacterium BRH_c4b]|nr:MAG: hypothetical protein VR69_13585 [Peptococcaceae bacterium BRH_c4b]
MKKYWISENEKISKSYRKILNDYLMSMKLANRSKYTINYRRQLLEKFLQECSLPLNELTPEYVLAWLKKHYWHKKEGTINNYISDLSCFFKFCMEEEYIKRVLIKNRWRPKMPRPVPKYLDKSEEARVRLAAEKLPLRDRAIIEFLLSSGCRCCEVYGLNIADVDLASRTARVVGKGRRIRQVHFSETYAILLKKYLLTHPKENPALFLNRYGNRLSIRAIQYTAALLGQRAGLLRSLSPHCFRHTFATNLLSKGAELDFIAEELGHKELNTTRIYANLPSEHITSLYRRYMG